MRITLSGDLGSGKSSVGRRLAEKLGIPHHSAGSLFREIGQISNLDALRTNLAAENNVAIDRQVDDRTRELDRTVQSFIIDARMAWHFVSDATRVYLSVSPATAAERIMADAARGNESYEHLAEAMAALADRRASETRRYQRLYGVDITDVANYDLVVITDDAEVDDIADLIIEAAEHRIAAKHWLPKVRIVPMIEPPASAGSQVPASGAPLPLVIADNFGFYFGDGERLATAFSSGRRLVPYAHARATPGRDVVARARRMVRPGTLTAWQKAAGVDLSFAKLLRAAPAA
jgi:predicted cytidylate kinase